jgi:hypothetical protein
MERFWSTKKHCMYSYRKDFFYQENGALKSYPATAALFRFTDVTRFYSELWRSRAARWPKPR